MPAIAVIDDRQSDRETISKVIQSLMKEPGKEGWIVIADDPPSDEREIVAWLDEHDAVVLVADWRLNEGAKGARVVNYEASALVREIRQRRPAFPIWIVTGYKNEVMDYLKDVENIVDRREFMQNAEVLVSQMVRAGQRRHEQQREQFRRFDELAQKVAKGEATVKEKDELRGLQGFVQAELQGVVNLDGAIGQIEQLLDEAEGLRRTVEGRLRRRKEG